MKTTFINWLQSPKLPTILIAVFVLMSSYSLVGKSIHWSAVFAVVMNAFVTSMTYDLLKKNDRNKDNKIKKDNEFVPENYMIFTYNIVINSLLFMNFFTVVPDYSFLQAMILTLYLGLSIMYCLMRNISLLRFMCIAVSISLLCLFAGAGNIIDFKSLHLFYAAVLSMLFGRGLIRNIKQIKDETRSIEDVLQIVFGCIAIVLSLVLCAAYFFSYTYVSSVIVFGFGFTFTASSLGIFLFLPKMRRLSLKWFDRGIIVMLIGIILPRFLSRFDYFVYLFNQAVYSLNHYLP